MSDLLIAGAPTEADWKQAEKFHGHVGPWLALGMRIGFIAVTDLSPRPHFGIQVDVMCPLQTPFSCLLDGLQISTGATYGKRNITAEESNPTAMSVVVTNKDTGRAARFDVNPETCAFVRDWFDKEGGEAAARMVWSVPSENLFVLSHTG